MTSNIISTKQCSHCKELFPATTNFFFKKVNKKGTIINGYTLKQDSISLRHICKSCHAKYVKKLKHKHRCKELGIKTYDKHYSMSIGKVKYPDAINMSINERARYYRFIRSGMSVEEYKLHLDTYRAKNAIIARAAKRKEITKKISKKEISRCLAANRMRIPVKDVNDELYKLYCKHIKHYRNVKQIKQHNKHN